MLKKMILSISLIVLISSCSITKSNIKFDIPIRSELPKVEWQQINGMYCVDEQNAKNLLKQKVIYNSYEEQLKTVIESCNSIIN